MKAVAAMLNIESSPLPPRRLSAIRRRLPYKNASLTPSTKPDGSRRITFAAENGLGGHPDPLVPETVIFRSPPSRCMRGRGAP